MSTDNLNKRSIGIIGDALAPQFNEAQANQMRLLSEALAAPVLTLNDLGVRPVLKTGRYTIVNGRFLRAGVPLLSPVNGALFYPFLRSFQRRHDTILVAGGIDSGFLPHLDLTRCILIVNSIPQNHGHAALNAFAGETAPRLKGIVVQSRRLRQKLVEAGVRAEKIRVVYPWLDLDRFRETPPPSPDSFHLLFASAPNLRGTGRAILEDKGIPLLLEAFTGLAARVEARLTIVWRGYYRRELDNMLATSKLGERVRVIDGIADMPALLAASHALVIPYRSTRQSPEIPLSAAEALAGGRPVITTDVPELAEIVESRYCGCVARPEKAELTRAMADCQRNYSLFQPNCRKTAEEMFRMGKKKLSSILK